MVEILGKKYTKFTMQCNECGTGLRFSKEDIESETVNKRNWEDSFTIDYIKCPNCECNIAVGRLQGLGPYEKYYDEVEV